MFLIIVASVISLISITMLSIDNNGSSLKFKLKKRSALGLLWLLTILFGCFVNVGANKVGITYNPFKGGIQHYTLAQGYNIKSPFTKVYKIDTEVNELSFTNISVQTNDSQYVNASIKVQVQIDANKAFQYFSKYLL